MLAVVVHHRQVVVDKLGVMAEVDTVVVAGKLVVVDKLGVMVVVGKLGVVVEDKLGVAVGDVEDKLDGRVVGDDGVRVRVASGEKHHQNQRPLAPE